MKYLKTPKEYSEECRNIGLTWEDVAEGGLKVPTSWLLEVEKEMAGQVNNEAASD